MHVLGDALEACKTSIHMGTPNSDLRAREKPTAGVEAARSVGGLNKSVPYALQSRARHFDSEPG